MTKACKKNTKIVTKNKMKTENIKWNANLKY